MSTEKSESQDARAKNLSGNHLSPKDSSHENGSAENERNQLRDEVTRKNEDIEKLTEAILSAKEHLSKAIDCLQKISTATSASATTNGQHTDSPKTPKQRVRPSRKPGSSGVLKRVASDVSGLESSKNNRPLKRSSRSAPDKCIFQKNSA